VYKRQLGALGPKVKGEDEHLEKSRAIIESLIVHLSLETVESMVKGHAAPIFLAQLQAYIQELLNARPSTQNLVLPIVVELAFPAIVRRLQILELITKSQ
jgi:hypothetical protein